MHGSKRFCQRGPNLTFFLNFLFFSIDEGIEDQNTTINGPSWARQQTPFKRRFAGTSGYQLC